MSASALRRLVSPLVVACLLTSGRAPAQSWREPHLAAFDEAWQTIQDTFYDPSFGGIDWKSVREELRPRAVAAKTPDDLRAVIREMLARLKRSHFALLSVGANDDTLPGPVRVPVEIRVLGTDVVITRVTAPAGSSAGLRPGHVVLEIDGRSIVDVAAGATGLSNRARGVEIWRRVHRLLYGAQGSQASLRVRDADRRERTIKVARGGGTGEIVTLGNLPPLEVQFSATERRTASGKQVGVIGFSIWMPLISERFADAIDRYRGARGIVIDLRGNPGGLALMMTGIAGHFFPDQALLGVMQTRQAPRLEFKANPQKSTAAGQSVTPFAGPVAILVDELTASASETFAAGMQSLGRARVFGTQTMGQALPASTRRLPSGDILMHAVGDFVTSTGRSVEGDGVIPDTPVALTASALAAGRDPALEAALAWIDSLLPRPDLVAMLQTPARHALPSAFWVASGPE